MLDRLTDKDAQKLVAQIEEPFSNLPQLPQGIVDFLVKIAPWVVAIGGIFSLFGALSSLQLAFGWGARNAWWAEYIQISPAYYAIQAVVQVAIAFLAYQAFKPLKEQIFDGWMYLFWMSVVSLVSSISGLIFMNSSIVMTLLGLLLGWYILFKMKPAYEAKGASATTTKKKVSQSKASPKKKSSKSSGEDNSK